MVSYSKDSKVIKLDNHRFYNYIKGRGFKSVDFLVIDSGILFLIELKNYINPRTIPSHELIASIFYQKCEDSLHLIEIVYKYYNRKWWYKLLVVKLHLTYLLSDETKILLEAHQLYRLQKVILLGNFDQNNITP